VIDRLDVSGQPSSPAIRSTETFVARYPAW